MNLRLLLAQAAPYHRSLALSGSLMLGEAALALALPWMGGRFAQDVMTGKSATVDVILGALLATLAAQCLLKYVNGRLLSQTSARVFAELRVRIYDHLQSLPLDFIQTQRRGDILALITREVGQLASFLTGTLLTFVPLTLTVAGAILLMVRIDAALAGVVAVLVPTFYLLLKVLGRRLRCIAQQLQKEDAAAIAIADENLDMLPAIKAFTREPEESLRHSRQIEAVRILSTEQMRIYAALEPVVQFVAAAATVVLLWLVSDRLGRGQATPAQMVSFLLYAALLTRPVGQLAGAYGQVQMARGTLGRLQEVFTEQPEPIHDHRRPLPAVRGDIDFRGIEFAYPGREAALAGLNLRIAAGETVAITGENGAGKSTLAHLLMRLHQPQAGQILIDGIDIAQVSLHSLRRQIGIVPQHVLLFNASVRDNIAYGLAGADDLAIQQAARLAQAHDFISVLPQGYETPVGDQGIRLSGGQRQRIALARALLKDPPILILDEATAMFDPAGEKAFIDSCRQTLRRRTVILITHRPASLALANRVVRLENGKTMSESAPCHAQTALAH